MTEIKRQDDHKFCLALNMVRAGAINDAVDEYFFNTHKNRFPEGVEPVRLFSTNNEVNALNSKKLAEIDAVLEVYDAEIKGKDEKSKERLIRDCTAMQKLELKKGAQVMILINDKNYEYVNGSMAIYLGKTTMAVNNDEMVDGVRVRLLSSKSIISIPVFTWAIENKGDDGSVETLASFKQFPVKLGWAITIHKSQGMTIDYLCVDLARCFAEGMAYVALSRAKSYDGLKIINWRKSVINCNKDAFNFYMGLKDSGVI